MEDLNTIDGILNTYTSPEPGKGLPPVAVELLPKLGLKGKQGGDGMTVFAGHDSGIPFVFGEATELVPRFNDKGFQIGVKERKYEYVQYFISRGEKPIHRIKQRPDLVEFDPESGDIVGGKLVREFLRFREGKQMEGTWIRSWDKLSPEHGTMLERAGIATVEQFASMPKNRILSEFPQGIVEAHDLAVHFVNVELETKKKFAAMEAELASLRELVANQQEHEKKTASKAKAKTKTRRRAK